MSQRPLLFLYSHFLRSLRLRKTYRLMFSHREVINRLLCKTHPLRKILQHQRTLLTALLPLQILLILVHLYRTHQLCRGTLRIRPTLPSVLIQV